jgi:hypothetical protein
LRPPAAARFRSPPTAFVTRRTATFAVRRAFLTVLRTVRRTARRWTAVAAAAPAAASVTAVPSDCAVSEAASPAREAVSETPSPVRPATDATFCAASLTILVALPRTLPTTSAERVNAPASMFELSRRSSAMAAPANVGHITVGPGKWQKQKVKSKK